MSKQIQTPASIEPVENAGTIKYAALGTKDARQAINGMNAK